MTQHIPFNAKLELPKLGVELSDEQFDFYDLHKIGVGIITHNRPEFLAKILPTIPKYVKTFIVNTGDPYPNEIYSLKPDRLDVIQCDKKTCVGHGKDKALNIMRGYGMKHLFTMEDDVYIKDPLVFLNYIDAAHKTGIWHFNFGFSQKENLDKNLNPVYRKQIEYTDGISIVLTPNLLGAFTYYHTNVIDHIGGHDPKFDHNHMDHVELTYRAIKAGLHPPFWWFADINNSWKMIGNLSNMGDDSLVRNEAEVQKYFKDACLHFKELHGYIPMQVPQVSQDDMCATLRYIHKNYKREYTDA
jgi:hypothetical protein